MRANRDSAFLWLTADNLGKNVDGVLDYYWGETSADNLPAGLDYFIFDCAFNIDHPTALRWLQSVLNIECTGRPDSRTLVAAPRMDTVVAISGVELLWRRRLKSLPNWTDIGRKHTNHINRVKHRAMKLISRPESQVA